MSATASRRTAAATLGVAALTGAITLAYSSSARLRIRSVVPRVRRFLTSTTTAQAQSKGNASAAPSCAFKEVGPVPPARRDDSVADTYFGKKVADPYRWLEDPDAEETKRFVEAQNVMTQKILDQCDTRKKFQERMTKMYDYEKYGCPSKQPSFYVYRHNSGLQAQSVLYYKDTIDPSDTSAPKVLIDPNALSSDGSVSLGTTAFSKDGRFLAYGLSQSGSDWINGKLLEVTAEGVKHHSDEIKWAKATYFSWTHDGKGFFYSRYPAVDGVSDLGTEVNANENHQIWYHRVGRPQSEDVFVFATPETPKYFVGGSVSDDGRYLFITVEEGCDPVNKLFYVDLEALGPEGVREGMPIVKLVDSFIGKFDVIANEGSVITVFTNYKSPKYRLIRTDLSKPQTSPDNWEELVPEKDDVLEWAAPAKGDALLLCYLKDAKTDLQVHSLATGAWLSKVPLPIGSVVACSVKREYSEVFLQFMSFLNPGTVYRLETADPKALSLTVVRQSKVNDLNPDDYTTEQVFVPSKDGTKVPMFIVSHKDFKRDGSAPALLYGYGGFSISLSPFFKVSNMCFVRSYGGVFAVANLRGGNEYGEAWHKAGSLGQKQNVFDDFQACAQYLVKEKFTSREKLAIEGGSNGGLLVGACVNQRPDLFAVGIAHVGVHDMLRFHKFTVGHAWVTDYGCSEESKEQFDTLYAYSPLHNVRKPKDGGQYPSLMLLTGDHDDRVVPLHTLKYTAELQHVLCKPGSGQRNPIIARIDTKSGHGAGKSTQKVIEEMADVYGFVAKAVGAAWRN